MPCRYRILHASQLEHSRRKLVELTIQLYHLGDRPCCAHSSYYLYARVFLDIGNGEYGDLLPASNKSGSFDDAGNYSGSTSSERDAAIKRWYQYL